MSKISFHGLIEKEGRSYTALCLELNIVSEGKTVIKVEENLKGALQVI